MFEMQRASHSKDTSPKEQIPLVQIVVASPQGNQMLAHSTPQSQTGNHMPIIINEQDYKKSFNIDNQQIYTLAPMSQYQVISQNSRDNHISLPSFSTPTYVVAATSEGHQLQPLTEIIQQHEPLPMHDIEGNQIIQVAAPPPFPIIENTTTHQVMTTNTIPSILAPPRFTSRVASTVKNRPFKCDQCTASFLESSELDDHRKKHTGDGPFTCDDCHFTFMYKTHYRSHKTRCLKKRTTTPVSKGQVIVSPNPVKRQFPINSFTASQLIQISNSKNGTTSVAAPLANRSNAQTRHVTQKQPAPDKFNPSKPSFKRARKEGRLDRPFECNECDASFQSEGDLRTHRTKHTGEGPFKCDDCQFVFLYRKLYEAHKRRCIKKEKPDVSQATAAVVPKEEIQPNIQYIVPNTTAPRNVYTTAPRNIYTTTQRLGSETLEIPQMQLVQPSFIEMRPAATDSQDISPHIIEQVIVNQNSINGRQEYKYEMIEGVNVNQIMNLIKVKDSQ